MQPTLSIKQITSLLLVFMVYSSANVFMKLSSSSNNFLSALEYFSIAIMILCIYACLWQFILKSTPLILAFMFKSITVVYGFLFASLLFGESISFNNLLGGGIIVVGIIILGWKG